MKNGIALNLYYLLKILENKDVHEKITVSFLMELSGLHAVGHLGAIFQNVMVLGKLSIARFRKWIDDGILDNIFRILSLEAELERIIHRCFHCPGSPT